MKISLTGAIVIAMIVGGLIGFAIAESAVSADTGAALLTTCDVLSKIFLKLIKTIVSPLIFSTLVVGIAAHSNLKQVGRMGLKAIIYFEVVTTLALFIGLAAINISKAGEGATIVIQQSQAMKAEKLLAQRESHNVILDIFPENIAKAVGDGQVLQVVVFTILFAAGLAMVSEEKRKPMLQFAESLSEVMFKFTNI